MKFMKRSLGYESNFRNFSLVHLVWAHESSGGLENDRIFVILGFMIQDKSFQPYKKQ